MNAPILLIHGYLDGQLDNQQLAVLEAWINERPGNAALFARQTMLHSCIRDKFHPSETAYVGSFSCDESGSRADFLLEIVEQERVARIEREAAAALEKQQQEARDAERRESMRQLAGLSKPDNKPHTRHYVIPKPLFYGSIGALVAVVVVYLYSALPDGSTVDNSVASPVLAEVTASNEAFFGSGEKVERGLSLRNATHELSTGTIELTFARGARITLQAPAEFELLSTDRIRLKSGGLVGAVPKAARGFTVETSAGQIVDLGTRFAVLVPEGDITDVHVFQGRVVTSLQESSKTSITSRELTPGDAVRLDRTQNTMNEIEFQTRTFATMVPSFKLLENNLILNGGFEADPTSTWEDETPPPAGPISGWKHDSKCRTIQYSDLVIAPPNGGLNYYQPVFHGVATQQIDLSILSELTDDGIVSFELSGWLGGYKDQDDRLQVVAVFLDKTGREVGRSSLEPVTRADRQNQTTLLSRNIKGTLPARTRQVQIRLDPDKSSGKCDAYADNVSFELSIERSGHDATSD